MTHVLQQTDSLLRLRGILNRAQLAFELGIKPETVFVWEKKGLPTIKEGMTILYDLDEVVGWMKSRSKKKPAAKR